ncbi:hypothetical protein GCM10007884_35390 [Methylobacterium brachythecii]|uniref:Uncharacterized protein n=1 Tax=Methylobacterium brachythecii TaxID=1176177 RepID=A0ABQ6DB58_9HYPH|nr:hypothetical protein GCM10007884_35390 [Methylobacterium brachythecii]
MLLPSRQRAAIAAEAQRLLVELGAAAHGTARTLARSTLRYGQPKDPFWSKVANQILRLNSTKAT